MTTPARLYLIHQYSRDLAVPSGSILMSTGCYLVQTDDRRNILIDSGMPLDADGSDPPTEESADILAQLSELGVRPEDVEVVICTHFDIDHVGHHERAVSLERQFSVDRQPRSYEDVDRLRASTRKLLDL